MGRLEKGTECPQSGTDQHVWLTILLPTIATKQISGRRKLMNRLERTLFFSSGKSAISAMHVHVRMVDLELQAREVVTNE